VISMSQPPTLSSWTAIYKFLGHLAAIRVKRQARP
jgi:hypothetical protein